LDDLRASVGARSGASHSCIRGEAAATRGLLVSMEAVA
jgi:hypothetical protein